MWWWGLTSHMIVNCSLRALLTTASVYGMSKMECYNAAYAIPISSMAWHGHHVITCLHRVPQMAAFACGMPPRDKLCRPSLGTMARYGRWIFQLTVAYSYRVQKMVH